jgi:hypothetical protein
MATDHLECDVPSCPYRDELSVIREHGEMLASHDAQIEALRETIRDVSAVSKGQTEVLSALVVSVNGHHERENERVKVMAEQRAQSDERNARGRWILGFILSVVSLVAAYHTPIAAAMGRIFEGK